MSFEAPVWGPMFITSLQYLGTGKMIPLVKSGPSTPVLDIAGTGGPMNFRAPVHTHSAGSGFYLPQASLTSTKFQRQSKVTPGIIR